MAAAGPPLGPVNYRGCSHLTAGTRGRPILGQGPPQLSTNGCGARWKASQVPCREQGSRRPLAPRVVHTGRGADGAGAAQGSLIVVTTGLSSPNLASAPSPNALRPLHTGRSSPSHSALPASCTPSPRTLPGGPRGDPGPAGRRRSAPPGPPTRGPAAPQPRCPSDDADAEPTPPPLRAEPAVRPWARALRPGSSRPGRAG